LYATVKGIQAFLTGLGAFPKMNRTPVFARDKYGKSILLKTIFP
jgi:hypothetical protein